MSEKSGNHRCKCRTVKNQKKRKSNRRRGGRSKNIQRKDGQAMKVVDHAEKQGRLGPERPIPREKGGAKKGHQKLGETGESLKKMLDPSVMRRKGPCQQASERHQQNRDNWKRPERMARLRIRGRCRVRGLVFCSFWETGKGFMGLPSHN